MWDLKKGELKSKEEIYRRPALVNKYNLGESGEGYTMCYCD